MKYPSPVQRVLISVSFTALTCQILSPVRSLVNRFHRPVKLRDLPVSPVTDVVLDPAGFLRRRLFIHADPDQHGAQQLVLGVGLLRDVAPAGRQADI